jgi:hypothetical protein
MSNQRSFLIDRRRFPNFRQELIISCSPTRSKPDPSSQRSNWDNSLRNVPWEWGLAIELEKTNGPEMDYVNYEK